MTEREMFLAILKRLKFDIIINDKDYLEFNNGYSGRSISAEFDKNGRFIDIYC